ncbi:biotin transporter BioY [Clostridium sp. DL1XJH146]
MRKINTRNMILIALFTALTAVSAFVRIPIGPVPFTLQIMFCTFAGILLGAKNGMISQLVYILIGLIGFPIFTNGGGITYIFQPTFGYLIGFVLCAFVIGKITEYIKEINFIKIFLAIVCGLLIDYVLGVTYLYLMLNLYLGKSVSILGAINIGFTPFIIPDLIKCLIVAGVTVAVLPVLRKNGYSIKPMNSKSNYIEI